MTSLRLPTPIDDYLPEVIQIDPSEPGAPSTLIVDPVRSWVPVETLPEVSYELRHYPFDDNIEWRDLAVGDRVDLTNTCPECDGEEEYAVQVQSPMPPCGECVRGFVVVGSATVTNMAPVVLFASGPTGYDETPCIIVTSDGAAYYFAERSVEADAGPLPGDWSLPVAFGVELGDVEAV